VREIDAGRGERWGVRQMRRRNPDAHALLRRQRGERAAEYAQFTAPQRAELHTLYSDGNSIEAHSVHHLDAVTYIAKLWERAKKFESPAAAERARESMRTRC